MTNPQDERSWPDDPLKAILSFHGRIRSALRTLDELGELAEAGRVDPMVARALFDFFSGPLVWHDFDEEASLMPRLRRVQHPPRLERMLAAVSEAHEKMETCLEEICPYLKEVAGGAEPQAEPLRRLGTELRELLEPHLRMEEQEIIPLARLLLSEDDLDEMRREMRERLRDRRAHVERAPELP
jgi:hemerythrin-like domain-containing protein